MIRYNYTFFLHSVKLTSGHDEFCSTDMFIDILKFAAFESHDFPINNLLWAFILWKKGELIKKNWY